MSDNQTSLLPADIVQWRIYRGDNVGVEVAKRKHRGFWLREVIVYVPSSAVGGAIVIC